MTPMHTAAHDLEPTAGDKLKDGAVSNLPSAGRAKESKKLLSSTLFSSIVSRNEKSLKSSYFPSEKSQYTVSFLRQATCTAHGLAQPLISKEQEAGIEGTLKNPAHLD